MLISIVVITYNQCEVICETLESIYQQTYSPLELIVTDDCSQDSTIDMVEKWIDEHKGKFVRTQVIKADTNTGVTANCNRGVAAANGEFMQLIAGDDILLPSAIKEKVEFAERYGLNYVVCKTQPFGDCQERVDSINRWCEEGYDIIRRGYDAQLNEILKFNFYAGPCGSFFRLKWFKEFGAFDERYPMMEDFPFIFRYIVSGNEIKLLEKVLTKYRVYNGSLSSSPKSPMWKSNWHFFFHESFPEIIKRRKTGTAVYMLCFYLYSKYIRGSSIDRKIINKIGTSIHRKKRNPSI